MQLKTKQKQESSRQQLESAIITDPCQSAKAVGLRYVTDEQPGIQRKRAGKGFKYIDLQGEPIRDRAELQRIASLAIPPAYQDVWICPLANGHLQATGRDAKGRKQYRYHPKWREIRDQTKFARLLLFSESLPGIRRQIEQDLSLPGLPREKVLATVVRLMEVTCIRVGNEEYARTNQSFGLTTMQDQHVDIAGSKIRFQFRGKSGVEHNIEVSDRRLAKIVKRCQDIPGQELFQYLDTEGNPQAIDSGDLNDYLREMTGQDFTAKDFRTWAGTVLAALELEGLGVADSVTQTKKNIVEAIKNVAKQLGNRPATCRKYYVHPAVLKACEDESLFQLMQRKHELQSKDALHELRPEELAVVAILEQQLACQQQKVATESGL